MCLIRETFTVGSVLMTSAALFLTRILLRAVVPDDVFAPDFLWKGSYDYKGQKQPLTLTVSSFNATSGKVNATLADSSVEFLLSGETSGNQSERKLNIISKDRCVGLRSLRRLLRPPPQFRLLVLPLCVSSSALFPPSLCFCTAFISSHGSGPLCCRSIQTPGGTVNASAIPDESAGPQLLEQDYR